MGFSFSCDFSCAMLKGNLTRDLLFLVFSQITFPHVPELLELFRIVKKNCLRIYSKVKIIHQKEFFPFFVLRCYTPIE
jgi:hypothetical protein